MEHAQMFSGDDPWYIRVRTLALALPGAQEKVSHGRPCFFTKKVFAYYGGSLKVDGTWVQHPHSVVLLTDLDGQYALRSQPGAYVPGYLGAYGWTGLDLDEDTDLDDLADWVEASYEFTAPPRPARTADPGTPFEALLSGGRPRTLLGVEEALADLRTDAARLGELIDCCSAADAVVRMRAVDALEKFARERPEFVGAQVERLFAELSDSSQPSIQWHLAQLWAEVPLTSSQHERAAEWLLTTLDTASDWIVLSNAMSALAVVAGDDPELRSALRERLRRHAGSRLPSVAKRASRLLAALD